jgi:hypothetical protein
LQLKALLNKTKKNKTNKISLAAGIAYTFLIYQEGIGVNILLLNIILIGL